MNPYEPILAIPGVECIMLERDTPAHVMLTAADEYLGVVRALAALGWECQPLTGRRIAVVPA